MSLSLKLTRFTLKTLKYFLPKNIDAQKIRALTGRMTYGLWIFGRRFSVRHETAYENRSAVEIIRREKGQHTILYLHGGGYFFGNAAYYRLMIRYLLKKLPATLYFPEYRLAPEHPFPAAFDDGLAWYQHLINQSENHSRLIVIGDSAGGGLALSVLQAARNQGLPMPAALVLFSPWTDLTGESNSMCECTKTDVVFCHEWFSTAAHWYAGQENLEKPEISPLFGEMHSLPPTLIFASNHEMLRDDSTRLAEKMQAASVPVELILRDHKPHVWPILAHLPEAKEALTQVAQFIRKQSPVPER